VAQAVLSVVTFDFNSQAIAEAVTEAGDADEAQIPVEILSPGWSSGKRPSSNARIGPDCVMN
jgi:hypothetical protein